MTACPHGMPTPGSCVECMDEGNIPPVARPEPIASTGFGMTARFPGHCAGCNTAIHEHQPIVRMTDNTYQHAGCAS